MSIVKALHVVQDAYGYLPDDALRALADRMGVRLYRLQEVASFFPHFRRHPPPKLTVRVCRDMACHLAGAALLREQLGQLPEAQDPHCLVVDGVSCLGRCDRAPVVCFEHGECPQESRPDPHAVAARGALADDAGAPHFDFVACPSAARVETIISELLKSDPAAQFDGDESYAAATNEWMIDPYGSNGFPPYEASRRLAQELLRDGALAPRSERPAKRAARPKGRNYPDLKDFLELSYPASICRLLERVDAGYLRGMGGGQAPAFMKMVDVLTAPGEICYVVANGDESEPGTFKDREIMVRTPHLIVEGVILAGLLLGAERGVIYVRHEYAEGIAHLRAAIREAERAGVCGRSVLRSARAFPVEVFVSPGGYICGEQSALIEVMEDKRAEPRNRPPELATNGLFDRPTLLNNVETLSWLPAIALNEIPADQSQSVDAQTRSWYASLGVNGYKGRRLFSISGDVAKPGIYELPGGAPLRQLIDDCAGGMRDPKYPLKAVAPSGPSGGFLPPVVKGKDGVERELLDTPLDIDAFRSLNTILGGGLVVYDASRDLAEEALNCTEFYRNESCGKCVPCRIGSQKLVEIGQALLHRPLEPPEREVQMGLVKELNEALTYSSICALGQSAPAPFISAFRYFAKDLERNGNQKKSSNPSVPAET